MATTEVHKIPITILSRCQRYDFRRITVEEIAGRLKELTTAENLSVEDRALRYVATAADGSMRDAISLLDQCVAFYLGETLTYDKVLEVLGTVDVSIFGRLMSYIRTANVTEALRLLDEIVVRGRELTQFTVDFTWYLRNLLLAKASEELLDTMEIPTDYREEFLKEVHANEEERLVRFIRIFSDLTNKIRYAAQKRVLVEVALIKLCKPQTEQTEDSISDRLLRVEEALENGVVPARQNGTASAVQEFSEPVEEAPVNYPKALPEDIVEVAKNWQQISSQLPSSIKVALNGARPSVGNDNELLLVFTEAFDKEFIEHGDHLEEIKKVILSQIHKEVEVRARLAGTQKEVAMYPDITKMIKKIPVEIVD